MAAGQPSCARCSGSLPHGCDHSYDCSCRTLHLTEASLFSQAGLTAFVYGPGDIAQAHTADEWVALEQLRRYTESVTRILQGTA